MSIFTKSKKHESVQHKTSSSNDEARLDESLLRLAVNEKWPCNDEWSLKLVVLWNKYNYWRVRANWYDGLTIGKIVMSKFFYAVVDKNSKISIIDKTNCKKSKLQKKNNVVLYRKGQRI